MSSSLPKTLQLATALASMIAGCGSTVVSADATPSDGSSVDVALTDTGADAAIDASPAHVECVNVRECAGRSMPSGEVFGRNWSCVLGTCTWEPQGGRTCLQLADGCLQCDSGGQRTCASTPCIARLDRSAVRFESANCSRDFFSSIVGCEGEFVSLSDGTTCLLTEAPTGAIRYVVSCGPCETVFTPM